MRLRVTVEGVVYDVDVEIMDDSMHPGMGTPAQSASSSPAPAPASSQGGPRPAAPAPSGDNGGGENVCKSPIAGTILQVKAKPGQVVALNEVILVMEAMKMETNIASPVAGTVRAVLVNTGDTVKQGQVLVEFDHA